MDPFKVTIFGAGKLGTALADLLARSGGFAVRLVDCTDEALDRASSLGIVADFRNAYRQEEFRVLLVGQDAAVAAVPDQVVPLVAAAAAAAGVHYLDFSRSSEQTAKAVEALSLRRAVLLGCGVSPGLVENFTSSLVGRFSSVKDLTIRVGAIPRFPTNRLGYGQIWNIDGLISEYTLPSAAIRNGKAVMLTPLEEHERFTLDGVAYEAFLTSGGIGDLSGRVGQQIENLTFKTIRHPGHLDYMRFLLDDLGLRHRRDMLGTLLRNGLPLIEADVVLIFITARGYQDKQLVERSYVHRLVPEYDQDSKGQFNALARVAAGYAATLLSLLHAGDIPQSGIIEHHRIATATIMSNLFLKAITHAAE